MQVQRVLLLIDSLGSGGAQRQVVETALGLDASRFEVSILIYHDIRELGAALDDAGIEVTLLRKQGKFDLRFAFRLWRYLRRRRPHIVHSFLFIPNVLARTVARLAGVPTVITSERNVDLPQTPWRCRVERLLSRFGDHVIVNAHAIKAVLGESAAVPASRISVIHNGVDTARFKPLPDAERVASRAALGIPESCFLIMLPGRLRPQKNHQCLLDAIAKLGTKRLGDYRVCFAGKATDASYADDLVATVNASGMAEHVIFLGRYEDMVALYAATDVVVLPSLWEGLPNVVLEAMACGRLVIASRIADNAMLLEHGRTGFLFPSNDSDALAETLLRVRGMDDTECAAIEAAARASMTSRFTRERLAAATMDIYQRVSSNHARQ